MPKASRNPRPQSSKLPSGAEAAFALWGRGNIKAARVSARELLKGEQGDLSESDRSRLERLLQDTAPDLRARHITVFAVAVVFLVILLTKLLD